MFCLFFLFYISCNSLQRHNTKSPFNRYSYTSFLQPAHNLQHVYNRARTLRVQWACLIRNEQTRECLLIVPGAAAFWVPCVYSAICITWQSHGKRIDSAAARKYSKCWTVRPFCIKLFAHKQYLRESEHCQLHYIAKHPPTCTRIKC